MSVRHTTVSALAITGILVEKKQNWGVIASGSREFFAGLGDFPRGTKWEEIPPRCELAFIPVDLSHDRERLLKAGVNKFRMPRDKAIHIQFVEQRAA